MVIGWVCGRVIRKVWDFVKGNFLFFFKVGNGIRVKFCKILKLIRGEEYEL